MSAAPSPGRILLVDHHHGTLRLLKRILEMHGSAVRAAGSLGAAAPAGTEQDYDVLLSTIHEVAANEPRRNACRSVRHRTAFSPVPGNFARRR